MRQKKLRIAYITAQAPYGRLESFVLQEIIELIDRGHHVYIIPRNPPKTVLHQDYYRHLAPFTFRTGLISWKILFQNGKIFLKSPLKYLKTLKLIFKSRNFLVMLKNLIVFPKGVWIAYILKKLQIEHLHVHWGSTPSTMAMISAKLADVPWSLTIHRYGLWEKNLLREKVENASFTRTISQKSRRELIAIVGDSLQEKIRVIHVGLKVPTNVIPRPEQTKEMVLGMPANFVEVKGHIFLIRAAQILTRKGIKNWRAILWGDGPLRRSIQEEIKRLGLEKHFDLPGPVPHSNIIRAYQKSAVQIVALPSIETDSGIFGGIPTSLMEAMAYRIPVIATRTGSIPELLKDGAGILIPQKSPEDLADAIAKLINDQNSRTQLTDIGFNRVAKEFDLKKIATDLEGLFSQSLK